MLDGGSERFSHHFVEIPTGSTAVVQKGEQGKTDGKLVGCRVLMFEEANRCIVSHFGPHTTEGMFNQLSLYNVHPEAATLFSLSQEDYKETAEWRQLSWDQYLQDYNELVARIRSHFPGISIVEETYPMGSDVFIDFTGSKANPQVRKSVK